MSVREKLIGEIRVNSEVFGDTKVLGEVLKLCSDETIYSLLSDELKGKVYFQPQFTDKERNKNLWFSVSAVYHEFKNAKADFPRQTIEMMFEGDIVNPVFVDAVKVFEDEVAAILLKSFQTIGMDKPFNFGNILEFVCSDISETADTENWNDSDVLIGFRRWVEKDVK